MPRTITIAFHAGVNQGGGGGVGATACQSRAGLVRASVLLARDNPLVRQRKGKSAPAARDDRDYAAPASRMNSFRTR